MSSDPPELEPGEFPALAATDSSAGPLDDPSAGERVIRGGTMRIGSFVGQIALSLIAVPLMVRHLGADDYGRYVTVTSIVFIISGFTEGGLMYLGVRHFIALEGEERDRYLRNLTGLRLVLTLVGLVAAVVFTWATGQPSVVVLGSLVAGIGMLLLLVQASYSVPLQAQLRFGALAALDLVRQAALTVPIVLLVAAGAGLVPFFWASVVSGAVVLLATLALVRRDLGSLLPSFDLHVWRAVAHEVLPYGIALAVGLIYFRLAVIVMSYIATPHETGIYSAAFRIVEVANSIPWVAVSAGFPILVHAAANDSGRLRYAMQRMFEASTLAGVAIALGIALGARFIIDVIAGPGFQESIPVLRLQGLALITCFLVATWSFGLLSLKRYRALLVSNALAAVVAAASTFALVPPFGAQGAAIATVAGEAVLAVAYLVALARADRTLLPRFGFLWKIAVAAGIGALAGLLPVHPVIAAVLGLAAYGGVAFVLRAIPVELLNALPRRSS